MLVRNFQCTSFRPLLNGINLVVSHSSWLCIISKLAEGGLYPFIQVVDDVEQDQTQYQHLGNRIVPGLQLDSLLLITTV